MNDATARALGLHHTVGTSIADLIDNCVDAGAEHVLVRFMQSGRRITGLRVVDDGRGMDAATIDSAMRYGVRRTYRIDDQGHFGVGLKAASLSQAEAVVVYSVAENQVPVGRRLSVVGRDDAPTLETLKADEAAQVIATAQPRFPMRTGTVVEWRGIRTFPISAEPDAQVVWLETTISDLQASLGLVFHRLLHSRLTIGIDVFDEVERRPGAPRSVRPIDPFRYRRTGASNYPRNLKLSMGQDVSVVAHVWPARSSAPEYNLGGLSGRDSQGFFVYRNERLLQAGGWLNVLRPRPDWALARVMVDITPALAEHITINPEKSGVTIDATLSGALHRALTIGYLDDAATAAKAARKVARRPITVVEPGSGLPDEVLDEFADSFTFSTTADPVRVGWRVLAPDQFFEVDLGERALWLNARYRRRLGGDRSSASDVPLLRTLMYLVAHDMFDGVRHSARQVDQMAAWQRVLIAAMTADEGNAQ